MLSYAAIFAVFIAALAFLQFYLFRQSAKLPTNFDGFVKHGFEAVQNTFKKNYDKGWDNEGSSFSVYHKGELVVDLWGGYANFEKNALWTKNTLSAVFSTTKGACAISLAMLVDRDLISYDDLVIKYWPEFGKNGKENITVRMLASHQAGLVVLDQNITYDSVRDWRKMSKMLEDQVPNWSPSNSTAGYHMITYGFLIDQLIRRVDPAKRSVGTFFSEEIGKPYDIEFFIGLPTEYEPRVAHITPPTTSEFLCALLSDPNFIYVIMRIHLEIHKSHSLLARGMKNPEWLGGHFVFNDEEFRSLEIGGANGLGTTRALAKLMCLFGSGKLVSQKTLDLLRKPLLEKSIDQVLNLPMTYGHGFEYSKLEEGNYLIGHSGYGGQNMKVDLKMNLCFAYLRNGLSHLSSDLSWSFNSLKDSVYNSLKSIET